MSQFYLIAEIVSVFEKNGFVLIKVVSDFPERFKSGLNVFIDVFGIKKEFILDKVKFLQGKILIKFKNFNSSEEVDFLIGRKIYIQENQLIDLPDDTYYFHELIGCKVYQNKKFFGVLKEVISLPANDVYVVRDNLNNEILIPAIKSFIDEIDPVNKIIRLSKEFIYQDED